MRYVFKQHNDCLVCVRSICCLANVQLFIADDESVARDLCPHCLANAFQGDASGDNSSTASNSTTSDRSTSSDSTAERHRSAKGVSTLPDSTNNVSESDQPAAEASPDDHSSVTGNHVAPHKQRLLVAAASHVWFAQVYT